MEGTPFGRYRLIEMLGRGGMGEVWRAYDTETRRVVAVKVLPANLASDPTFEQRFRREAYAAAGLNEPHIVPIHSFGEIEGRLYVDMRLVEGRDLQQLLSEGAMDPGRAVAIVAQVASALQAAHRIGLVHRDVKPSNILVADDDFAYLIDFGIARGADDSGLTGTGSVIGTYAYMAPERFTSGTADIRSDIYALACVLYECVTSNRPFPGESVEQQIAGHLNTSPPRPSITQPGVSPQFDAVIAAGMAKNPDHRYSSTLELAHAARSAVTGPIPMHGSGPMRTPPAQYGPPPPFAAPPGPAPRQTLTGQSTQYGSPGNRPPPPPPTPPAYWAPPGGAPGAPTSSRSWWSRPGVLVAAALVVVALVATTIVLVVNGSEPQGTSPQGATGPGASEPVKGPLDGAYTAQFGAETSLAGKARDSGPGGRETWVFESVCKNDVCVATATKGSGTASDAPTLVFDKIGDQWLAVSTTTTSSCKSQSNEKWEVLTLDQRPDGTLTGDYAYFYPVAGCTGKNSLTLTPTGTSPSVSVADPAGQQPRAVVSIVQGLQGKYHQVMRYAENDKREEDYDVRTYCLRTVRNCATYAVNTDSYKAYVLEGNNLVRANTSFDAKCSNGGNRHVETTELYALPQPPQDPITLLTGRGHLTNTGDCPLSADFDSTFTQLSQ